MIDIYIYIWVRLKERVHPQNYMAREENDGTPLDLAAGPTH